MASTGGRSLMDERINMVGKRYGRLTVLAYRYTGKGKQAYWTCHCDCGNLTTVRGSSLRQGDTKSCGCYAIEQSRKKNGLPKGEAAFRILFRSYKKGAKTRGYKFELSEQKFRVITSQNCHYCGAEPTKICRNYHNDFHGSYTYNGIDRVDNSKGYIEGNVVPCCEICNKMKMTRSQEEFLEQIKKIATYLRINYE